MLGLIISYGLMYQSEFSSHTYLYLSDPRRHEIAMRPFSAKPGVMVNFESPIYINGRFTGFDGWNMTNDKFRAANISYIVRVEFANQGFIKCRLLKLQSIQRKSCRVHQRRQGRKVAMFRCQLFVVATINN